MTDITCLSIPHAIIDEAKNLKINCSKIARNAIVDAIKSAKEHPSQVKG